MDSFQRNKIIKMLILIAAVFMIVGIASYFHSKNSMTLDEYAAQQGKTTGAEETVAADEADAENETVSPIVSAGNAALSDPSEAEPEVSDTDAFYYTTLSDKLINRITGVSYPASGSVISYDELRYVHILHYDFNGEVTEGELICNESIADDLLEIFYELYRNEYQIEKVRLIDEYGGDDEASMEDNNTSCFNYRVVEGSSTLSKHALGVAIDINPLYNPYLTYNSDGTQKVSPASGEPYADRTQAFPYKIDENDLCYKLFTEHGFTWGGNWNAVKDYQHFQKNVTM